jgi:hypothetical protein
VPWNPRSRTDESPGLRNCADDFPAVIATRCRPPPSLTIVRRLSLAHPAAVLRSSARAGCSGSSTSSSSWHATGYSCGAARSPETLRTGTPPATQRATSFLWTLRLVPGRAEDGGQEAGESSSATGRCANSRKPYHVVCGTHCPCGITTVSKPPYWTNWATCAVVSQDRQYVLYRVYAARSASPHGADTPSGGL